MSLPLSFSSPIRPSSAWSDDPPPPPPDSQCLYPLPDQDVATKVLRRVQVSKMTRQLQNRLALANVKIKHGWENLSIDSIEPKIEMELNRKRRHSSIGPPSDDSSTLSDRFFHYPPALDCSPLAPIFSDDVDRSGSSTGPAFNKRSRFVDPTDTTRPRPRPRLRTRHTKSGSWKRSFRLPESSPAYRHRHRHQRSLHFDTSDLPAPSFRSESTVADVDDLVSLSSEDDDADLPLLPLHPAGPHLHSSPPKTPPPVSSRGRRSGPHHNGEEGAADLLMYLAASPSPLASTPSRTNNHHHHQLLHRTPGNAAPSTPPAKYTPLPSSMMSTPGGTWPNFPGFGAVTPGTAFNFSDYVNVTPSPGPAAWRTPGGPATTGKTPLTAKEARRRALNFDVLLPPMESAGASGSLGLGMELGGELVSSQ